MPTIPTSRNTSALPRLILACHRCQEPLMRPLCVGILGGFSSVLLCSRPSKCGDQLLELWVGPQALQVVVDDQAISIFKPATDGFLQILKSVIGKIGGRCHTGEVIPHREGAALSF